MHPLDAFRLFVEKEALPAYSGYYGYGVDGFNADSIAQISDHDASWFLEALRCRVVTVSGHYFDSSKRGARGLIFNEGAKTISPRPITLAIEPIISIGGACRLHQVFG